MGYSRPFDLTDSQPIVLDRLHPAENKLLGLELLRFVSALAVLFFHYSHFADMAGMPPVARASVPFYGLLWPLYDYGQFGVQIFWGISGYIFFWKYGAAIHSRTIGAEEFFWLRFSRLYPLHLVTLIAIVGLQRVHLHLTGTDFVYPAGEVGQFARQLFLATDWGSPATMSFNGPIWSISAEVAVYAGFFCVLRYFAPTLRLCILITMAGLALQLGGLDWVSIACATYFFAGGMAALSPARSELFAAIALAGVALLCATIGALGDRDKLPMILLVAVPLLLVLLSRDCPILRRWQRPVQFAGNLTYSSYLLHFPLQLLLAIGVAATGIMPLLTSPLFLTAYLGVTLTAAACSYSAFELPAQRWLRRRTLLPATA